MREFFRYFTVLDGCSINDVANAESGYNYYLFLRPGGSGVIMREKENETEYRFSLFGEFTESIWTNHASLNYKRTSEYKKL